MITVSHLTFFVVLWLLLLLGLGCDNVEHILWIIEIILIPGYVQVVHYEGAESCDLPQCHPLLQNAEIEQLLQKLTVHL